MAYRLPPLSTLRVFEAAARHLSFRAAADELLLTPSAVSRGVQTLEQWLGLPLFTRGRGGIALTEAGAAYVAGVREALDRLVLATGSVPGRGPRGSLAVSAAPTFGRRWLVPRLGRFRARHPDVALTLDTTHRQADIPREPVDLAFRMGGGDWPGLEAMPVLREELVPVCAPALAGRVRAPSDLAGVPLLHVTTASADWAYWAGARGVALPDGVPALRFDTVQHALDAAAAGLGVALGRRPLADPEIGAGTLAEVLGPPVPAPTAYWLVCAPQALARAEVRAFRAWVAAEAAGVASSGQ